MGRMGGIEGGLDGTGAGVMGGMEGLGTGCSVGRVGSRMSTFTHR